MSENELSLGRVLLLVVAAIVLLPLLMMALAVPMMGMMGGYWMGPTNGYSALNALFGIGWLLVVFGGGYLIVRALLRRSDERRDPALEELRAAYARGDITDEEFENRRETLRRD